MPSMNELLSALSLFMASVTLSMDLPLHAMISPLPRHTQPVAAKALVLLGHSETAFLRRKQLIASVHINKDPIFLLPNWTNYPIVLWAVTTQKGEDLRAEPTPTRY